ncbi:MAG TPA: DUF2461 domain-containing protein [Candidatus Dormibacteraeota bacterium]|jgi:uncharacterized protein (TIGR02453 family)
MGDRFQGWPEDAQRFFIGLQLDNSKAYFEAHRATYLRCVRGPMEALVAATEPEFGASKIFRANRDIRFSADKSPYRTDIAATVGDGWVSLSAGGLMVASGWYQVERPELERFRAAVAGERGVELASLLDRLRSDGFEVWGEELKLVPKPHAKDHPRAALLRHKRLLVGRRYGLQPWLGTPEALDRVVAVWRAAGPVMDWVRASVA